MKPRIMVGFQNLISSPDSYISKKIYSSYWVSKISNKKLSEFQKAEPISAKVQKTFYKIHLPENWRLGVFVAATLVFAPQILITLSFLSPLVQPSSISNGISQELNSILGIVWQVLAAIISITFVIVVFIVQFANEREYEKSGFPIFLAETELIFTASFGLLSILSVGIALFLLTLKGIRSDFLYLIAYWQLILFLLNIFFTVKIFTRTIKLLSPPAFRESFKNYNRHQVMKFVRSELSERVSQNVSRSVFEDIGIDFPYFEPSSYAGKVQINLPKLPKNIHRVEDINLKLIEIAAKRAKKLLPEFNKSDFIFYAKLGHRVSKERPGIALVHPAANEPLVTSFLQKSVKVSDSFKFANEKISNVTLLNRDFILHAIQNLQSNVVQELLDHYRDLLELFLESVENFGIQFTQEQVQKETQGFSDWKLINSIQHQYVSLIEPALKSDEYEILKSFLLFPIQIMSMGILHRDHLLYERFSILLPVIYFRSHEIENPKQTSKVVEVIFRLLIDHHKFTLNPRIENPNLTSEDLGDLVNYLIQLLTVWSRLLKEAINFKDIRWFREFARAVRKIQGDFFDRLHGLDIELLEMRRDRLEIGEEREKLDLELQQKRARLNHKNTITSNIKAMFLGTGGWLSNLFNLGKISEEDFKEFISVINPEFQNTRDLYEIYSSLQDNERYQDLFNWDTWATAEWDTPYGEIGSGWINTESWLEDYFLIRSIELSNPNEIINLPPSSQTKNIYASAIKKIGRLEENGRWHSLLGISPDEFKTRSKYFLGTLLQAAYIQEEREENTIIKSPLDGSRVEEFKNLVHKSWQERGTIRKLATRFGTYLEKPDVVLEKTENAFGFSVLDLKEPFIDFHRTTYSDWGEHHGYGMARTEDTILTLQMMCGEPQICDLTHLDVELSEGLSSLQFRINNPIILFEGASINRFFHHSTHFTPHWKIQDEDTTAENITGLYHNCPVFRLETLPENTLVLIDFANFGTLVQLRVVEGGDYPFDIKVSTITDDTAKTILSRNPKWRIHPQTKVELGDEAAIRQIQLHLDLQIWEFCEFIEIDPSTVRIIKVNIDSQEGEK